jgi:hypothetical protein
VMPTGVHGHDDLVISPINRLTPNADASSIRGALPLARRHITLSSSSHGDEDCDTGDEHAPCQVVTVLCVVSHEERVEYVFSEVPFDLAIIDLKQAIIAAQDQDQRTVSASPGRTQRDASRTQNEHLTMTGRRRKSFERAEVRRMPTYVRGAADLLVGPVGAADSSKEKFLVAEAKSSLFKASGDMILRRDGRVVSDFVSSTLLGRPPELATLRDVCYEEFTGRCGGSPSIRDPWVPLSLTFHLYAASSRSVAPLPLSKIPAHIAASSAVPADVSGTTSDVQRALERITHRLQTEDRANAASASQVTFPETLAERPVVVEVVSELTAASNSSLHRDRSPVIATCTVLLEADGHDEPERVSEFVPLKSDRVSSTSPVAASRRVFVTLDDNSSDEDSY